MPFSFIEIEEKKSRSIFILFIVLILFYFLTAWFILVICRNILFVNLNEYQFAGGLPDAKLTLAAFFIALIVAFLHWTVSTSNLIEKISLAIDASPIDTKDTYHQYLKNIVDEVSVAVGGRRIEAYVIPVSALNAFSLVDTNGIAVIGVTEGLLTRLNRAQIEAVVGHEAGHIVSGDCFTTTITCSLSELYKESLSKLKSGLKKIRGRAGAFVALIFLVLIIMDFLNKILKCFISRQREYRADAIAVRLTRNPLSLAQALKLISQKWHGAGIAGENLESIFIVNPQVQALDDEEGLIAGLFSTHPPVNKRIEVLLNMGHSDELTLEESLKTAVRVSPVAKAEFSEGPPQGNKRWLVSKEGIWQGPFTIEELKTLKGFLPTDWIKLEGHDQILEAFQDEDLACAFGIKKKVEDKDFPCPHCRTELPEINYEGVPIKKCSYCEGSFVEYGKISRIFIRQDKKFSEDLVNFAEAVLKTKLKYENFKASSPQSTWILDCPKCHKKMHRQFFVYSYPVEIDRCQYCAGVWFDKEELEALQYIYEHKERFFDGEHF
ncbi:MAG: zinc metalloprotease HtpX [Candidatus Omnitrophota bacterium]